jgi:glutamine synthetase
VIDPRELVEALEGQAIVLEQYCAELGHGQQEISTGHAPALQAADEQLLVRETIRAVATRRGLVASLAPKPWPENAGNGAHVHFSLWEGSRNRFYEPSRPDGLSNEARSFMAGVLAHLPGLCGLSAPSFNSYQAVRQRRSTRSRPTSC